MSAFTDTELNALGILRRRTIEARILAPVLQALGERFGREAVLTEAARVIRCRYAEMYRALGVPELGALLSCNRDAALIEGFNPEVTFERTQTLMQGASHCDFRYQLTRRGSPPAL